MAAALEKPADILDLPKVIDGRAMFTWMSGFPPWVSKGRKSRPATRFSEASLCLDATIAGQGVMLAWQTIASHQLQHGQLVAPFGPR